MRLGAVTAAIAPATTNSRPGQTKALRHTTCRRSRAVSKTKTAMLTRMAISRRVVGKGPSFHRTLYAGASAHAAAQNAVVRRYGNGDRLSAALVAPAGVLVGVALKKHT